MTEEPGAEVNLRLARSLLRTEFVLPYSEALDLITMGWYCPDLVMVGTFTHSECSSGSLMKK